MFFLGTYLNNKHQYVAITNIKFDIKIVISGAPQELVLGPKSFLLYINNICTVSIHKDLQCLLMSLICFALVENQRELFQTTEMEFNKLL